MVFTGFLPEANQINHQIRFSPLSLVLAEESLDYCSLALMAPAAPVAPDDHNIHGFFGLFGMIWNGDLLLIHLLLIKFLDDLELIWNCLELFLSKLDLLWDNIDEPCD